jgi:hypothetical protein
VQYYLKEQLVDMGFFMKQNSMKLDNSSDILQYAENLMNLQRFYYIDSLNVVCYIDGSGSIQLTIYTFYNNVPL